MLDPIRTLVRNRIEELGLNYRRVSEGIGKNETYIWQYLFKSSPKTLPETEREAIAEFLELPESSLRPPRDDTKILAVQAAKQAIAERKTRIGGAANGAITVMPVHGARDVPLYLDVGLIDRAYARDMIERPSWLDLAGDLFALDITTDRARLKVGDRVIVRVNQPPRLDDMAVVMTGKHVAAIGKIVEESDDAVKISADTRPKAFHRADHQILKIVAIILA